MTDCPVYSAGKSAPFKGPLNKIGIQPLFGGNRAEFKTRFWRCSCKQKSFFTTSFCKDRSSHFLFVHGCGNDFCIQSSVFCSDPMRNVPKKKAQGNRGSYSLYSEPAHAGEKSEPRQTSSLEWLGWPVEGEMLTNLLSLWAIASFKSVSLSPRAFQLLMAKPQAGDKSLS